MCLGFMTSCNFFYALRNGEFEGMVMLPGQIVLFRNGIATITTSSMALADQVIHKGSAKHEEATISDVQSLLTVQSGVLSHDQLKHIIAHYYSEGYAEQQVQKMIICELSHHNIAIVVNEKLPNEDPNMRLTIPSPRK
jgi:hypothetical protein